MFVSTIIIIMKSEQIMNNVRKFRSRRKKKRVVAFSVLLTLLICFAIIGGVLIYDSVYVEPIRVGEDTATFDAALGTSRTEDFEMVPVVSTSESQNVAVFYPDIANEQILNQLKEFCATHIDSFSSLVNSESDSPSFLHMVSEIYPLDARYLNVVYTKTTKFEDEDVLRETITLLIDLEESEILTPDQYFTDVEEVAAYCRDQLGAYEQLDSVTDSPKFDEGTSNPDKFILKNRALTILYDAKEITLDTDLAYYISVPIEKLEPWLREDIFTALLGTEALEPSSSGDVATVEINDRQFSPELPEGYSADKKYLSFVYSGGPTQDYSLRILQYFLDTGGSATFSSVGILADQEREIVNELYLSGAEIANNSYDLKAFCLMDTQEAVYQVDLTNDIITEITGTTPISLLPPFLEYDSAKEQAIPMNIISATMDWTTTSDASLIMKNVLGNAKHGDTIMLNDTTAWSAEATEIIVRKLAQEGFEFITASEMMAVLAAQEG